MSSRRRFLLGSACLLGAGALGLPGLVRAGTSSQRKFLFVTATGGWDVTWALAPEALASSTIWTDPDAQVAEIGGLSVVDSGSRPSVRALFEAYGDRTCILGGFEVRSVTHERCRRILMTGSTSTGRDGWSTRLGLDSPYELPVVVGSGPSYSGSSGSIVARLGRDGQLAQLLDGSALERSDLPASPLTPEARDLAEAWLDRRAGEFSAQASAGQAQRFASANELGRAQVALLDELGIDLGVEPGTGRTGPLLSLMSEGLTRCGMVEHLGLFDTGWDLRETLDLMSSMPGEQGGSLLDETVVVVLSEMGRAPVLNTTEGKDHWTFTSALLIGDGVRPGQVGLYDEVLVGEAVDLETGRPDSSGTHMTASNLGATLLALGGVDFAETDAAPVLAALAQDE
jgi:hypothetical protein